jgi:hypothetical protein
MEVQKLYRGAGRWGDAQCGLIHIYDLDTEWGSKSAWLQRMGQLVTTDRKAIVVTGSGQPTIKKYLTSISGFFSRRPGTLYAKKVGTTRHGGTIWLVSRDRY